MERRLAGRQERRVQYSEVDHKTISRFPAQFLPYQALFTPVGTIMAGYFQGVHISQILQNENFREDCIRKVATLGTWGCGFPTNFSNFKIHEIYTPRK